MRQAANSGSWLTIGRVLFWLAWPALWLYLRWSLRTRALVVCDDELLVVHAWISDGRWLLPGGGRHKGESALHGVRREVYEETGIAIDVAQFRLLGAIRGISRGLYFNDEVFLVNLTNKPESRPQRHEINDIAWLKASELTTKNANADVLAALRLWSG